ncbi:tyrosine-type recombinase/integrase [Qipengyuania sp. G39]|uniref:Tyrosine-type recombinase/integrase n=1 Tax=Qipengyuania profundimaris TaxID=3067652 RepID=A0ABT9HMK6_9SPHN|nr:tyrosine-type recombinase/integrase [Qipengyuania sp. G39]MDP4574378.1 tyrosine-type recombinase/integrase [Qipengyuania sp. G39]
MDGATQMTDLSKLGHREALRPRKGDEPHWQRLRPGCFLGYRPAMAGGAGNWLVRVYEPEKRKYVRKALGSYPASARNEVFAAAKKDAEAWAAEVDCGGALPSDIVTVKDACEAYLKVKPGTIAAGVFRRHVYDDPISSQKLDKLRRHHLEAWRARLEAAPALLSRSKKGPAVTKVRAPSTINRDMVPVRAALNRVLPHGRPNSDAAWQEALRPIQGADSRRTTYLNRDERELLINAMPEDAGRFFKAMCVLPLRPGAVASLNTGDFEPRTRTLMVLKDKAKPKRQITVPPSISDYLAEQVEGKRADEAIFTRSDGARWTKDKWKHPIKNAASIVDLSEEITAYTLRHSAITDLVIAGVPLMIIAQISGTSVTVIEKHYAHLIRKVAEDALDGLVF